jgi:photosystem II stability/assembly factor-like uncharacterized protein
MKSIGMLLAVSVLLAGCNLPGATETASPQQTTPGIAEVTQPPATSTPEPTPTPTATPTQPPLPMHRLERGEPVTIRYIEMKTLIEGWALGGEAGNRILHTSTAGVTWIEITPPDPVFSGTPDGAIAVLEAHGEQHAWVHYLGSDRVWRTNDAGAEWQSATVGYPETFQARLLSAGEGLVWLLQSVESAMGSELVGLFHTTDGGASWQEVIDPYENEDLQSCLKTGIAFVELNLGWATYNCQGTYAEAFLDRSVDWGSSWEGASALPLPASAADSPEDGYCWSRSPVPEWAALVVECLALAGDQLSESAYLYRTIDGGQTWQIYTFPGGEPQFMDGMTIYTMNRGLYLSVDGGVSWTKLKSLSWDGQFSFVGMQQGWAVATNEGEIAFVTTKDGGRTWAEIKPLIDDR